MINSEYEIVKQKLKDDLRATGADKKTEKKYLRALNNLRKTRPGIKTKYTEKDLIRIQADLEDDKKTDFAEAKNTKRWYYYFLHHLVTNILNQKWPLTKRYIPEKPKRHEVTKTVFSKETIDKIIERSKKIDPELRFLAVVSTVYGIRRIELCSLTEEDVGGDTLYIRTRKGGEPRTHLIPEGIKDYVKPKHANDRVYNEATMTRRFWDLEEAVGIEHEEGYGWHSIRRRLATELNTEDNGLDREEIFMFMRWSRFTDRLDEYTIQNKDEMSMDQEKVDRKIFEAHPFLEVWT